MSFLFSRLSRRVFSCSVLCLCFLASAVVAQPPTGGATGLAAMDDYSASIELGRQLKDAPAQTAIAAWTKFYESRPNITPGIGINVTISIADLYGDKLNDKAKVLEIVDWGLKKYERRTELAMLLWRKTKTLLALKS